jgi:DNA-binding HxlR family transcriptional regulator
MQNPTADICNAQCPSRNLIELLAEKWALLVIFRLAEQGPSRTSELRRGIGGVSEKMLIQTLRNLERHGLIQRIDFGEVPPRVEYRLTRIGQSLSKEIEGIERWVARNLTGVLKARNAFDSSQTQKQKNLSDVRD